MFHDVSHIWSIFRSLERLEALVLLLSLSFAALLPILDFQGRLGATLGGLLSALGTGGTTGSKTVLAAKERPGEPGFALKTDDFFLEQLWIRGIFCEILSYIILPLYTFMNLCNQTWLAIHELNGCL